MADILDDVLTALNQARFEVADDFDKMRTDNMKFYKSSAQAWVTSVGEEYGYDGISSIFTYRAAFLASTGEVLLDFVQGVGAATFIDPLRLGAGVKKGTAGGYLEDALRVVGVVGGALKLLKFAKFVRGASKVGGGMMSCLPTSAAKSVGMARLIGFPTVEEMAQATAHGFGKWFVRFPRPYFNGSSWAEVLPMIEKAGLTVETQPVKNASQIVNLVNQNKGPVLFGIEWPSVTGAAGNVIPGSRHAMMAYRPFFGSGIRLADQFGNLHTLETVKGVSFVKLGKDVSTAGMMGGTAMQPGAMFAIKAFHTEAYVVRDLVLLDVAANLPLAQRVGVPLYESIDDQFWPKLGFAASRTQLAPTKLAAVGAATRNADNGNSGQKSNSNSTTGPKPSDPPFSIYAKKAFSLMNPPNTPLEWKGLRAKMLAAGIPSSKTYEAIQELEGWGAIEVKRAGSDELNFVSILKKQ